MNYGRAMHALCIISPYLFAISGTQTNDENASFRKCEKLDLNTNAWTPISDCLVQSSGCLAVQLN